MTKTETPIPIFAHSSIPEFEHDGDTDDRNYLPGRALAMALLYHPHHVLLPDSPSVNTYAAQMGRILDQLDQRRPRTIMIPDTNYFLDLAILQHLDLLTAQLNSDRAYQVFPYARTANLDRWMHRLQDMGYRATTHFPPRDYFENLRSPQHRGGWARWVTDPQIQSFPQKYGLSYPPSWAGTGLSQILEAYHRLTQDTGQSRAFFKPIFSAGGFTLREVSTEADIVAHYQKLDQAGALYLFGQEIPVEIQASVDIHNLKSLQYDGGSCITPGGVCTQIQSPGSHNWSGNIFNTSAPEEANQAQIILSRLSTGIRIETGHPLSGSGGLDFAQTSAGSLVILEHNGARVTGAHPAIAMAHAFGVSDRPFILRKTSNPGCDLATLWSTLQKEHLAFGPQTKTGVFPLLWIEGQGFLFAADSSEVGLLNLTDRALATASQNGYVAA